MALERFLLSVCTLALLLGLAGVLAGCSLAAKGVSVDKSHPLETAYVKRVVDGDTLIADVDGVEERVRLVGIDAPESVHPDEERNSVYGRLASEHMNGLVHDGALIWLQREVSDRDDYGRLLRHIWLDEPSDLEDEMEISGKMLDAMMVSDGYARAVDFPPDTGYSGLFHSLEDMARSAGAGVIADL